MRIIIIGAACWFRSVNSLSVRTIVLTLAAATSNDHNNNNNNNNIKMKVIPVLRGTIGTISQLFIKYLSKLLGKHKIKELQKSAILDTDWVDESE